ncbi:putative lipoprotein NlpE involved in copper resistance [Paenibacillus sp. 4624]|uniref:Lipoprotein n=1 Tax=Paenibacillus amylolyticus TaxID=1451 RepID=A0A5M9X233_PAEAM|nr:hypothetical protein [Paenibacillus amylolyticus]KAA8787832.1 hypothetical protein EC604_28830 [Paenibacillus amylolyticus]
MKEYINALSLAVFLTLLGCSTTEITLESSAAIKPENKPLTSYIQNTSKLEVTSAKEKDSTFNCLNMGTDNLPQIDNQGDQGYSSF